MVGSGSISVLVYALQDAACEARQWRARTVCPSQHWVYGCRAAMVGSGGISALVSALQDGSMRAKAAASRLLLGFAAEGPDAQEWIAAAPGAIAALVDLLR